MLFIYVQESHQSSRETIETYCKNELPFDWETRVVACVVQPEMIPHEIKENDMPALFIIQDEEKVIFDIRKNNFSHYLILIINSLEESILIRPSYYRPSGFLVSPVSQDKLALMLESVYSDFSNSTHMSGEIFPIKINGTVYPVPYRKIAYFESARKKVIASTDSQQYEFYGSIEQIIADAPAYFMRVHRSFCVNTKDIQAINFSEMNIVLKENIVIPISRTFKPLLEKELERWNQKTSS